MLRCLRCHAVTPLSVVCAGLRRFAAGGQKDLEDAQKELDEFFGNQYVPPLQEGSSIPFQSVGTSSSSPLQPPAEIAVTAQRSANDLSSQTSMRSLSHVDAVGRASMVDVAEVCNYLGLRLVNSMCKLFPTQHHCNITRNLPYEAIVLLFADSAPIPPLCTQP